MQEDVLFFPINPTAEAIIGFSEACAETRKQIVDEGVILTGLAGLGVASMLFGGDKVIEFFRNAINAVIKLMRWLMDQLKKLWKWITISSSDIGRANAAFLSKYGPRLMKVLDIPVMIDGYDMNPNVMAMASNLAVEYSMAGSELSFIGGILNGEYRFRSHDDVFSMITKNRMDILDLNNIGSRINNQYNNIRSDEDFRSALINRLYGYKHQAQYIVSDALAVIKSYTSRISAIIAANKNLEEQGSKDIDKLEALRDSLSSGTVIKSEVKTDVIQQFNWFIEYKQKLLSDYVLAFQIMIQYANEINTQAKAICIKALQDN